MLPSHHVSVYTYRRHHPTEADHSATWVQKREAGHSDPNDTPRWKVGPDLERTVLLASADPRGWVPTGILRSLGLDESLAVSMWGQQTSSGARGCIAHLKHVCRPGQNGRPAGVSHSLRPRRRFPSRSDTVRALQHWGGCSRLRLLHSTAPPPQTERRDLVRIRREIFGASLSLRGLPLLRPMLALSFALVIGVSANAFAAPRALVDDGNGLLDVYDFEDLDAIRADPTGTSMYGSADGCPTNGCVGFELLVDLDFAQYQDNGVRVDWVPIPTLSCVFEGNGHTLTNLTQDKDNAAGESGLFAVLDGAQVNDLKFADVNLDRLGNDGGVLAGFIGNMSRVTQVSVVGGSVDTEVGNNVGGLIGRCEDSDVEESYSALSVRGNQETGGLVGYADNCFISRSFVLGRTTSARHALHYGGLVGYMVDGTIADSFVSGSTGFANVFGGLIGKSEGSPLVENSYVSGAVFGIGYAGGGLLGYGPATFISSFHALDTTGYTKTKTAGDDATAVTLADLQCPTAPNDPNCVSGMFDGWDTSTNLDGAQAWDFGSAQQAPALRIRGVVYRDSDGDGLLDPEDDFPFHWAGSLDSDGDGAIDFWREGCDEPCRALSGLVLDQFPNDADVTLDLDLDGKPDAWNPSCDTSCQAASSWTLDPSLDDWDNDYVPDLEDTDDDGDGIPDVDPDSNNLIDIDSLALLDQIRNDTRGASLRNTSLSDDDMLLGDHSGCRPRIVDGVLARHCDGYELTADLDFDTNHNGQLDAGDWNEGQGFTPIGRFADVEELAFHTNFEGNGHTIANLLVDSDKPGLFGDVRGADIRNLGLVGLLGQVTGDQGMVGALVGGAQKSRISNCYSSISVSSSGHTAAGGLVGEAYSTAIVGSFAAGHVMTFGSGGCRTGGLVGALRYDSSVTASFATGFTSDVCSGGNPDSPTTTGGLVGLSESGSVVLGSYSINPVHGSQSSGGLLGFSDNDVVSSYWATDTSTQSLSAGNAQGVLVDQLSCPTEPDDTTCAPGVLLFAGWDDYVQTDTLPYWDFGTSSELPGLCMNGTLHRSDKLGFLQAPMSCGCSADTQELVTNRGFESGTSGWSALGSTLSASTAQAYSGSSSLRSSNRSQTWNGAEYTLLGLAEPGETLSASAWVRIEGDQNEPVMLTLRATCTGEPTVYTHIAQRTATDATWIKLSGTVDVPDCQLTELVAYVEGPQPGVTIFVDDVSIGPSVLTCAGGTTGDLYGDYIVPSDWGTGYCLEMVIHNPTAEATSSWFATVDLNGATIDSYWNLNISGSSGTVTMTSAQGWGQEIAAGGNTYSLGFCANRPPGNTSLPEAPVVTATF